MSAELADTNVILYLLDDGPKADKARAIVGQGPRISVQVLNETLVNCRRKAGLTREDSGMIIEGVGVVAWSAPGIHIWSPAT